MVASGDVVGAAWRLDARLGEGGLATVFSATHLGSGARAAIKILHGHHADDADVRTRFAREAEAANRIAHPGVVRVLGDGVDGDVVYLVMELVEGRSLKAIWVERGRKLPLDEVAPICTGLLEILVAAHGAGVLHRDLKPDNVLIDRAGRVRLVDFGVARIGERTGASPTREDAVLGTPAFMAPEQALSRWDEVDARTDLFAVAATVWTALAGRLVHEASTVPALLIAAATRHAAPILGVLPDLPPPLAHVLDWALKYDRSLRPASAAVMLDAWRRAVDAVSRRAPLRTIRLSALPPPPVQVWPVARTRAQTSAQTRPGPTAQATKMPTTRVQATRVQATRVSPTAVPETNPHGASPAPAPPRPLLRARVVAALAVALGLGAVGMIVWLSARGETSTPATGSARRRGSDVSTAQSTAPSTSAAKPKAPPPPFKGDPMADLASLAASSRAELSPDTRLLGLDWQAAFGSVQVATRTESGRVSRQYVRAPGDGALRVAADYPMQDIDPILVVFSFADFDPERLRAFEAEAVERAHRDRGVRGAVVGSGLSKGSGALTFTVTVAAGTLRNTYTFDMAGALR